MGRPTKRKDGQVMSGAEREAQRYKRKRKSINRRRRTLRKLAKQDNEAQLRREASRSAPPLPDGAEYLIGDWREVLDNPTSPHYVADASVPLIITDLPYGNEAEPLYERLGRFSERVLIQGGSVILYTGQGKLDRDMAILSRAGLKYWWLCMMPHIERQKLLGAGVFATFKPVLWFVKGHRRTLPSGQRPLMTDQFISPARDKLAHAWAQGEGGVWVPIEHLTEPDELIIDPCAGTGKWGRTAAEMGRRWIGCDIEAGGDETILAA
jgi:hypothetical protein